MANQPLELRAMEAQMPAIIWKWGAAQYKAGQDSVRHSDYEERALQLLSETRLELDTGLEEYGATIAHCRALRAALLEVQEALNPFYAYACLEDDLSSGHSAPAEIPVVETTRNNIHAAVTVGHFRRARQ